jgi:hypothetical protein
MSMMSFQLSIYLNGKYPEAGVDFGGYPVTASNEFEPDPNPDPDPDPNPDPDPLFGGPLPGGPGGPAKKINTFFSL